MPPVEGRVPKSKLLQELDGDGYYDGLEVWSLPDVVFLDDSPAVLGRVVTVDQLQAIVDISCASSESGTMGSTSGAQSTLKVCLSLGQWAVPVGHAKGLPESGTMGGTSRAR